MSGEQSMIAVHLGLSSRELGGSVTRLVSLTRQTTPDRQGTAHRCELYIYEATYPVSQAERRAQLRRR